MEPSDLIDYYARRAPEYGRVYAAVLDRAARKNFPTTDELRATMQGAASTVEIVELSYYWTLRYVVGENA